MSFRILFLSILMIFLATPSFASNPVEVTYSYKAPDSDDKRISYFIRTGIETYVQEMSQAHNCSGYEEVFKSDKTIHGSLVCDRDKNISGENVIIVDQNIVQKLNRLATSFEIYSEYLEDYSDFDAEIENLIWHQMGSVFGLSHNFTPSPMIKESEIDWSRFEKVISTMDLSIPTSEE